MVSITQRYIIGPYIASIITPRAVLIGGEAILKCHPITHIAIGTSSYFYLRPMCSNKRLSESIRTHLARNQSYTRRAVYARARPSRNIYLCDMPGKFFCAALRILLVSFLLDAYFCFSCRYQSPDFFLPSGRRKRGFCVSMHASDNSHTRRASAAQQYKLISTGRLSQR